MQSRWSDADARKAIEGYAKIGVGEDLALRTYTTRLLGGDPLLVLHGGGNTSVKTRVADPLGEMHEVLCVKGSGWDMGTIEPAGLPAVKLAPLRALRTREHITDEDMVAIQRANLVNQPDSLGLVAEVYDGTMGFVPYVKPGFGLAKAAGRVFEEKPDVEGLIL